MRTALFYSDFQLAKDAAKAKKRLQKQVLIRITEKILVLAIIRDFRFMETVQWMKMVILTHLLRENL